MIVTTRYQIKAPFSMRIALVSDLHDQYSDELLLLIRRNSPDLICVAGDTLERHDRGEDPRLRVGLFKNSFRYSCSKKCSYWLYRVLGYRGSVKKNGLDFLMEASKIAPIYVSLGNHEWYLTDQDRFVMESSGVHLLDNRFESFAANDSGQIWLGGLSSGVDLDWLNHYKELQGFKILLCHHPEYYDRFSLKTFPVVLSGHAHGGQFRLGKHGLYAPNQGLFPKYCYGKYGSLIVSAGCSNTTLIPRIGNPCELVMVTLADCV